MHTELLANRYELGEVIGRGGMGEVRCAHDTRLNRDVAVKFLRIDLAAQPEVRARFENEARNAGQLTHPNVVTVYDSGEHHGQPFIVMECLPGRTLRDEIAKGPIPESFARVIALDVLAGLEAAHDAGIVHRDVAPSNILLTDNGRAKIADFGIAKATEGMSTTMAGLVVGTPAYLSPARLEGAPALPGDDIYALGVVLYEAVTGERLYTGSTPVAIATTILTSPPPPLRERRPDLSPAFVAAVEGAMSRRPATRLTTAAAMRNALETTSYDQTAVVDLPAAEATSTMPAMAMASAPAVGVMDRVPPLMRRTPRDVWLAIGAIAAVIVLLLALASRDNDGQPTNETVPTTIAPIPTTVVEPPTTEVAVPSAQVNVRRDVVNTGGKKAEGKAKRGKRD